MVSDREILNAVRWREVVNHLTLAICSAAEIVGPPESDVKTDAGFVLGEISKTKKMIQKFAKEYLDKSDEILK